ncbi:MAG: ATP-binding cassette domain-containing protein, partial [Bacteroidota bacterium]|nr:ATP-binding cassette domain-containing protein [Bacteroidota bacterium]
MNYLQVENLSKSFGDHDLFHNITFGIDCGQKVALIARNGAGKTTLLNIIAGKDIPDSGKVTFRNDLVVSYLTQDPAFNNDLTVLQVALGSSKEIIQTIELYEEAIVNHDKDSLGEIIVKMDALEAWDYEATVKQILGKLKINEFNKRIGELSGGQKKRIALANAIINEPDVMILDEPTNHLDLEMIEWL